ncbi:hypothetical protein Tco_0328952 [Tanacetum coccineum]
MKKRGSVHSGGILHTVSDYDNSDLVPQLQNVSPSADTTVPSQQELDILFGPLYDEFFNAGTSRVNKSSSPTDNSTQQDTPPTPNIHPTSEPSTLTNVHAKENSDNQADTQHEFTNPFCTLVQEVAESSSRNIGNSNMHTFNQPQDSEYRWTKDHPLTSVRGNPILASANQNDNFMSEELHQFKQTNQSSNYIDKPFGKKPKGYAQEEGIDFEESFAPVARCGAVYVAQPGRISLILIMPDKSLPTKESSIMELNSTSSESLGLNELLKILLISQRIFTKAFSNADHAGCVDTRKSTSGGIQFLGADIAKILRKRSKPGKHEHGNRKSTQRAESTDKAKITRKRLKPGKHEHGNGRAHKEPGECYLKSTMVNSSQPSVKHGQH